MAQGESFQDKIAKETDGIIGQEMRGCYKTDSFVIFFSNDIVCSDYIMEVKSVDKNRIVEDWYFNNSIVQCAVYKSLLSVCDGNLITSKFFVEQGNPCVQTKINDNIEYYLLFGDNKYLISVTNTDKIIQFISAKALASMDWTEAKKFDTLYKHKEYETLKDCFSFSIVN